VDAVTGPSTTNSRSDNDVEQTSDSKRTRKGKGSSDDRRPRDNSLGSSQHPRNVEVDKIPRVKCHHCGQRTHLTAECDKKRFNDKQLKYYNPISATKYTESSQGKKLKTDKDMDVIGRFCKYSINDHDQINLLSSNTNTIPALIFPVLLNAQNGNKLEVRAFADPGAVHGSYVSEEIAQWLADNGTVSCMCNRVVCGAVGENRCVHAKCCHTLNVTLLPDKTVNNLTIARSIDVEVAVIKLQHDIVIGLPTFREHDLFLVLAPLLRGVKRGPPDNVSEGFGAAKHRVDFKDACRATVLQPLTMPESTLVPLSTNTQQLPSSLRGRDSDEFPPVGVSASTPPCGGAFASKWLRDSVDQDVLDADAILYKPQIWVQPDSWGEIRYDSNVTTDNSDNPRWLNSEEISMLAPDCPTKIWGTRNERTQLVALCTEYIGIFGRVLNPQAALVPPMEIIVDDEKWFVKGNQLPPRTMNSTKQVEVARRTAELVEQGVIRPYTGRAWSQVVLVERPDKKWRFTHDFRRLNACTTMQAWPIPKISEMIDRLGAKRANYFATLDLKDGYFQTPLSAKSAAYTCFTTFGGLYVYNRVPQGLTGARELLSTHYGGNHFRSANIYHT